MGEMSRVCGRGGRERSFCGVGKKRGRRSVKKRRKVGALLSATRVRKLGRVNIIYILPLF
jgi:hypothetical protein